MRVRRRAELPVDARSAVSRSNSCADDVTVVNRKRRQALEALEQALGLDAAVRLDIAHDDVAPGRAHVARSFQHRVGLADAGGGSEKDAQSPALCARFLGIEAREQLIRVRPFRLSLRDSQSSRGSLVAARRRRGRRSTSLPSGLVPCSSSSARLSSRTFTRGSPRNPANRSPHAERDQTLQLLGRHLTRSRDARKLVLNGRDADFRIEPAAGGRHEIHGYGCRVAGIQGAQRRYALLSPRP